MPGKRTKTVIGCSGILISCVFMVASLSAAASLEPDVSSPHTDSLSLASVNTEFGGFDLEISRDFSHITLIAARLQDYRCGGITISGLIKAQSMDIWPIVNNQFDVDTNLGIYRISISGVFNEDHSKVCGTWVIRAAGTTCSGTWESP